jgi:hypothetical protein
MNASHFRRVDRLELEKMAAAQDKPCEIFTRQRPGVIYGT